MKKNGWEFEQNFQTTTCQGGKWAGFTEGAIGYMKTVFMKEGHAMLSLRNCPSSKEEPYVNVFIKRFGSTTQEEILVLGRDKEEEIRIDLYNSFQVFFHYFLKRFSKGSS